jgi:hypothetical protein
MTTIKEEIIKAIEITMNKSKYIESHILEGKDPGLLKVAAGTDCNGD